MTLRLARKNNVPHEMFMDPVGVVEVSTPKVSTPTNTQQFNFIRTPVVFVCHWFTTLLVQLVHLIALPFCFTYSNIAKFFAYVATAAPIVGFLAFVVWCRDTQRGILIISCVFNWLIVFILKYFAEMFQGLERLYLFGLSFGLSISKSLYAFVINNSTSLLMSFCMVVCIFLYFYGGIKFRRFARRIFYRERFTYFSVGILLVSTVVLQHVIYREVWYRIPEYVVGVY